MRFRAAEQSKKKKQDAWEECISAYNADEKSVASDYKTDMRVNIIFSIVETIKPLMMDKEPSFLVEANIPEQEFVDENLENPEEDDKTKTNLTLAQKLQFIFEYEVRRQGLGRIVERGLTRALLGSPMIVYLPWDGEKGKFGEISPKLINARNFFVDPMATESLQDGEYVIWADYMNTKKLQSLFPEKKEIIVSEHVDEKYNDGNVVDVNASSQTLVFVAFLKDYSLDEEKNRKFPNGRMITYTKNCILEDKKNPYKDGKFPFCMYSAVDDGFSLWGEGVVRQLLSIQENIDELNNQVIDNAKMTANMQWIIDKNSGIEKGRLTNRPGLIVRKNPGTEVRRDAPPPMPSYVGDKISELKRDAETISGIHDITQGRRPAGITAAAAIDRLQEAGQGRVRLMVRRLERFFEELGEMQYSRMKQFWIAPRKTKAIHNAFDISFIEISKDDLTDDIPKIYVLGGATMPRDKGTRLQQYVQLAQTMAEDGKPMVDREAILLIYFLL